jgi:ABC-type transporter Mla subunit MlaD
LTARDDQLRSLIENSNRVFAATASRDRQLEEAFVALPTFERESAETVDRLAEFAVYTDPLITQLRPAARELSPTLEAVAEISPDLKALFTQLPLLFDASVAGFPAAERVLDDARPLLAQIDPAMRQLIPILEFVGLYPRELNAFFANSAAATQARDPGSRLHYLRTTNPLNPENLAIYPTRIGSNRPNPYAFPNAFDKLPTGLDVFDDRQCSNPVPTVTNVVPPGLPVAVPVSPAEALELVPDDLLNRVIQFAFAGQPGTAVAPPCRLQAKYDFGGEITQYPHVRSR